MPRFAHAELHAAMGAAVDQHVDRAVLVADRDDLAGAEAAALEVAGIGDLGFEAGIEPRRAGKDSLLLAREDVGVGIDPVRHPRRRFRPAPRHTRSRSSAIRHEPPPEPNRRIRQLTMSAGTMVVILCHLHKPYLWPVRSRSRDCRRACAWGWMPVVLPYSVVFQARQCFEGRCEHLELLG